MPPKVKFTKEQILDAAFEIANDEGFDNITVRKVADKLGSSVAPIYVSFNNLDELKYALGNKIATLSAEIMLSQKTHDPFLDIGAGNIKLAMEYTQLFRDFHLNPNCKQYFKLDNKHQIKLIEKMSESNKLEGLTRSQMGDILNIMGYVTYGIIFELLLDKVSLDYEEIIKYLENVADDVIAGYKIRKGVKQ